MESFSNAKVQLFFCAIKMLPEINSRDLYTTHIGILFTILLAFITLI